MLDDIITLGWVDLKRAAAAGRYWLKLLSFDPDESWLYQLYASSFWVIWLFLVWAFIVEQARDLSLQLSAAMIALLLDGVPYAILALQLIYLAFLLRRFPILLTRQEMVFAATSPIARGAIALTHFWRQIALTGPILAVVSALFSMILTWPTAPTRAGVAGVQGFLLAFPLVWLSVALGLTLGLLSLNRRWVRWRAVMWAMIPLLGLAAIYLPEVTLWPGQVWQRTVGGALAPGAVVALLALVVGATGLLLGVGNGVHMLVVMERSQLYARIQSLGLLARVYAPAMIRRIESQAALSRQRRLRWNLSEESVGEWALWNRTLLALLRLSPRAVLRLLGLGATLALIATSVVGLGGAQAVQSWMIVLVALVLNRPADLVAHFRQDVHLPFMRQFIPQDNLRLFVATCSIPALLVTLGGAAVLFALGVTSLQIALLLPLTILALTLWQALEMVEGRRSGLRRLPYEYAVVIGGALVIGAGLLAGSLWAAAAMLIALNTLSAFLLADS